MAQQNQQLSPELIKLLLGGNITAEEAAILQQQKIADQLGQNATRFNPSMGRGVGGAMGALAQGLQGYASGDMDKKAEARARLLGEQRGRMRQGYFEQLFPQKPAQAPVAAPGMTQDEMLREQWDEEEPYYGP